jgi:outer membrane protein assembly factor BamB
MAAGWPAPAAESLPLGHADFRPSPQHPVGERGDWTGLFPGAKGVALAWDHRTGKNIAWKCRLPGWSNSSPIVVGDKVFVGSEPDELLCIDARSGKLLWRKSVFIDASIPAEDRAAVRAALRQMESQALAMDVPGKVAAYWLAAIAPQEDPGMAETAKRIEGVFADIQKRAIALNEKEMELGIVTAPSQATLLKHKLLDPKAWSKLAASRHLQYFAQTGLSMPTPASDGAHVWFQTSLGAIACLDLEGNVVWNNRLPAAMATTGKAFANSGSPLVLGDRLVYSLFGRDVYAVDKRTGRELWKFQNKSLGGRGSSAVAPMRLGNRDLVLAPGTAILDAATGAELGRLPVGGDARRGHTVFGDSVIFTFDMRIGRVRLLPDGEALKTQPVWFAKGPPWQCSVVSDGHVYFNAGPRSGELTGIPVDSSALPKPDEREWARFPAVAKGRLGAWSLPDALARDFKDKKLRDPVADGGWQYAAPAVADGHLFIGCDYQGMRVVRLAGSKSAVVSDNFMDLFVRGNPFFQGAGMYVRSFHYLYCIRPSQDVKR